MFDPNIAAIDHTLAYLHGDLTEFNVAYVGDMTLDDWMTMSVGLAGMLAEHLTVMLGRDGAQEYLRHLRVGSGDRIWMGNTRVSGGII